MNEDAPIPYSIVEPCEVELIFVNNTGHGRTQGDKCSMPSVRKTFGKWVCWCHHHALLGPRMSGGTTRDTTDGEQFVEMPVDFYDPRWANG